MLTYVAAFPPPIVAPGRNVWSRRGGGPFYQLSAGTADLATCPDFWSLAFAYGVIAIKKRINALGYSGPVTPLPLDETNGFVGPATDAAIRWVQAHLGFTGSAVDGVVGPNTARALFAPIAQQYEAGHHIPRGLLRAGIDLESLWDPGAQGDTTPDDLGLQQINTRVYPTPVATAYDVTWAIHTWSVEMMEAYDRFVPDNAKPWQTADLRVSCTAGAHYAPGWAQRWWDTGRVPPAPAGQATVQAYAHAVISRLPKFT